MTATLSIKSGMGHTGMEYSAVDTRLDPVNSSPVADDNLDDGDFDDDDFDDDFDDEFEEEDDFDDDLPEDLDEDDLRHV